ncbi:Protein transport protein SFT2 [Lamellibrachia satsuma]|nr:Protein transport protein SFT2 [Lamellibrachia satsuma]
MGENSVNVNINNSLQAYLSKSSDSTSSTNGDDKRGYFSWLHKKEPTAEVFDDTSNGWFNQAQKDPCLPSLSKKQRILGFVLCLLMGTFCFSLASLYLPFLVLKARKFVMLYSLGSLFIIFSFSLLWGPSNHLKHLFSGQRIMFTTAYFGTMFATLYFALWVKSTILTLVFAVCQILALIWYIVSYIPGGQTGLRFFSRIFYATASKTAHNLPV